jgi:hypothetical protein
MYKGKQTPGARSPWRLNRTVALNICGPTVWNLVRVAQSVAPVILRWLVDFWKICVPLMYVVSFTLATWKTHYTAVNFVRPLRFIRG